MDATPLAMPFLARFLVEKNAGYTNSTPDLPHAPPRDGLTHDSLHRKECVGVRKVITKFSRMDSLPNFLPTHGGPLHARASRYAITKH